MALSFSDWVSQTQGKYWDMDGAYGAQCWDLWAKYCMDMYGCSVQECITPTGYAAGNYTHFPTNPKMSTIFEKKDASYSPVPGDVAFWNFSSQHSGSHVSIVTKAGVENNKITVLSQNPNPAKIMTFELYEFLGYLHPKNLAEGGTVSGGGDNNNTGNNNPGFTTGNADAAWIQQSGDHLILHDTTNSGTTVRTFWKTTAQNWLEKTSTTQPDSSNGQGHPNSSTSSNNSFALYVVGTVESSCRWDAVESTLQGIGIAQWSFGRRLQVLNKMKAKDSDGYAAFKTAAPEIASLMESGGTFTRALTSAEASAFKTWASRSAAHEGQRDQFAEDYAGYPQTYTDQKMQILWVTAYHQSPAGALKVPKASDLAGLKSNILSTSPFGPYTTRYNTAYSLLANWDGKSNPPSF